MAAEPASTDPDDAANAPVRQAFGQQTVNQGHGLGRNRRSGMVQGELMSAYTAQIPLFAGMGVTVFDDIDALARWTRQVVHALLNGNYS
ncbi:hypothetical protein M1R55_20575 (plasmid) [Deinococcus sp. QL22]|nr:hypothetical protein [Deinococcus sp. QL22]UQN08984.1 hypothetical protein M1R55_20575 [Deinococcus sp. QL22]